MYLDADGKATDKSQVGYLAPATPGTVMGLSEAHRRFGRLPFADVVNPAIALARNGFVLDSIRSARIRGDSTKLAMFPASAAIYLPGGQVPARGSVLLQAGPRAHSRGDPRPRSRWLLPGLGRGLAGG